MYIGKRYDDRKVIRARALFAIEIDFRLEENEQ